MKQHGSIIYRHRHVEYCRTRFLVSHLISSPSSAAEEYDAIFGHLWRNRNIPMTWQGTTITRLINMRVECHGICRRESQNITRSSLITRNIQIKCLVPLLEPFFVNSCPFEEILFFPSSVGQFIFNEIQNIAFKLPIYKSTSRSMIIISGQSGLPLYNLRTLSQTS